MISETFPLLGEERMRWARRATGAAEPDGCRGRGGRSAGGCQYSPTIVTVDPSGIASPMPGETLSTPNAPQSASTVTLVCV